MAEGTGGPETVCGELLSELFPGLRDVSGLGWHGASRRVSRFYGRARSGGRRRPSVRGIGATHPALVAQDQPLFLVPFAQHPIDQWWRSAICSCPSLEHGAVQVCPPATAA